MPLSATVTWSRACLATSSIATAEASANGVSYAWATALTRLGNDFAAQRCGAARPAASRPPRRRVIRRSRRVRQSRSRMPAAGRRASPAAESTSVDRPPPERKTPTSTSATSWRRTAVSKASSTCSTVTPSDGRVSSSNGTSAHTTRLRRRPAAGESRCRERPGRCPESRWREEGRSEMRQSREVRRDRPSLR